MKYACETCNELQQNIDNMFVIGISIAKYVDELESQRNSFRNQCAIEAEARAKLQIELDKKK